MRPTPTAAVVRVSGDSHRASIVAEPPRPGRSAHCHRRGCAARWHASRRAGGQTAVDRCAGQRHSHGSGPHRHNGISRCDARRRRYHPATPAWHMIGLSVVVSADFRMGPVLPVGPGLSLSGGPCSSLMCGTAVAGRAEQLGQRGSLLIAHRRRFVEDFLDVFGDALFAYSRPMSSWSVYSIVSPQRFWPASCGFCRSCPGFGHTEPLRVRRPARFRMPSQAGDQLLMLRHRQGFHSIVGLPGCPGVTSRVISNTSAP